MKQLQQFPWSKLKKGEGFFIPSLNPERTIKEARFSAYEYDYRLRIEWKVGRRDGLFGVLFIRSNGAA